MARPNKKHHTIPRIYLQAFANSDGKVWVANKDFKLFPQKPENILSEGDYFTIRFPSGGGTLDVETKFLNGIEGSYADIFRKKISPEKQITTVEKAKLSVFLASMMERQSQSRKSMEVFFKDVEEHIKHLRNLPESSKRRMAEIPSFTAGPSISAEEMLEAGKDVGSLHTSLLPGVVENIAPIIFKMKWVFTKRPKAANIFITSDNPFTLVNPPAEIEFGRGTFGAAPGLAQKDVEISLPLSSDIAVLCSWDLPEDLTYRVFPPEFIDDVNRRTKRNSGIIIGSSKDMLEGVIAKAKEGQKKTS